MKFSLLLHGRHQIANAMRLALLIIVAGSICAGNMEKAAVAPTRIPTPKVTRANSKSAKQIVLDPGKKQLAGSGPKTRIEILVLKRTKIVQCCGRLKCTVGRKRNNETAILPNSPRRQPDPDDKRNPSIHHTVTSQQGKGQVGEPGGVTPVLDGQTSAKSDGVGASADDPSEDPSTSSTANDATLGGLSEASQAPSLPNPLNSWTSVPAEFTQPSQPQTDPGTLNQTSTSPLVSTEVSSLANFSVDNNSQNLTAHFGTSVNSTSPATESNSTSLSSTSTSTTTTPGTTTTTIDPAFLCSQPDCGSHQTALKSPLLANITVALVAAVTGSYKRQCSRFYFVSGSMANVTKAHTDCMVRKMNLVTPKTDSDWSCLRNLASTITPAGAKVWTSGSNEGEFCHKHSKMRWCPDATVLQTSDAASLEGNTTFWNGIPTPIPDTGRCVAFKSDAAKPGLLHDACTVSNKYVCEPPCLTPTCPTATRKNISLFDAGGKLIGPNTYGNWIVTCGRQYLFGNKPVTWKENIHICGSLGMAPLVFETAAEQKCVGDLAVSPKANWKWNFNYWTGGTSQGCSGYWWWCGSDAATPPILTDEIKWETGQPDNRGGIEDCSHLRVMPNKSEVWLTDRNCSYKYIYACESAPMDVGENLCINTCPKQICARKATLFNGDELANFRTYGDWFAACGRQILFSKANATWEEARQACCDIGMTLASLESTDKNQCYSKLIKSFQIKDDKFWLSGTDSGCANQYFWCSRESIFLNSSVSWHTGSPDKAADDCVTAVVNAAENVTQLATGKCTEKKRFICEVRKKGTTGRALAVECMELWDITEADAEVLLLGANNTYSSRIKCFMKCLGEGANIFLAGQLVVGESLKMMETAMQEVPEELEKGFTAFVDCTSIKDPDECSTAAATYDCGKERISTITQHMVNGGKGNSTVYSPPMPCIPVRKCLGDKLPCIEDPILVGLLKTTSKTPNGKLIALKTSKRSVFFSTFSSTGWTFDAAYSYCCSIGMRLIEFFNYNEMKELATIIAAVDGDDDTIISDVQTLNATHEIWCGSRQVVDKTIYYDSSSSGSLIVRPIIDISCSLEFYNYDMAPYPNMQMFTYSSSTKFPGFFGCGSL